MAAWIGPVWVSSLLTFPRQLLWRNPLLSYVAIGTSYLPATTVLYHIVVSFSPSFPTFSTKSWGQWATRGLTCPISLPVLRFDNLPEAVPATEQPIDIASLKKYCPWILNRSELKSWWWAGTSWNTNLVLQFASHVTRPWGRMTDTARSRKICIKELIEGHHHHL